MRSRRRDKKGVCLSNAIIEADVNYENVWREKKKIGSKERKSLIKSLVFELIQGKREKKRREKAAGSEIYSELKPERQTVV